MKNLAVVLVGAATLYGCGIASKMDALSNLDALRAAYKTCMTQHKHDPSECEAARLTYQAGLSDAGKTRGILTNWPRI
jgi:hypothetical protein